MVPGAGAVSAARVVAQFLHRQAQCQALDGRERRQQVDRDNVVDLDVGRELPDGRRGLVPGDDHAGLVVLELVAEFPGGVQRVVFHDDGAEAEYRVEGDDVLRAVRQDQGHPVAGPTPSRRRPSAARSTCSPSSA